LRRYGWRVLSATTAHRPFAARLRSGALVDAVIAATALAGSLALLSHDGFGASTPGSEELDLTAGVLAACSTMPLLAWRRAPRAVFASTAAASVLLGGLGYAIELPLGLIAALYLLAASRDEEQTGIRHINAIVVALLAAYLVAAAVGGGLTGIQLSHAGLAWAVAWFAGERARLRREHVAELRERAVRAEREAERERRLATAEERARIARDLHDSAGHAINVIALRAGTARLRYDEYPGRGRATLEGIEDLARHTVAEIDQIVGALRDEGSAGEQIAAPPGLASLDTLIAHRTAAGLDVTIATVGAPRALEAAVDRAAYRILQEGLTNAARHGAGDARVDLRFGEAALEIVISNAAVRPGSPMSNGGHGLIGMHERAALLGGSLDAQAAWDSFCVRAALPYGGLRS
jgi:signal transduction histidine kinase